MWDGEKNVSGLFKRWFVTSLLPPIVTIKIPRLTRIVDTKNNPEYCFLVRKLIVFSNITNLFLNRLWILIKDLKLRLNRPQRTHPDSQGGRFEDSVPSQYNEAK